MWKEAAEEETHANHVATVFGIQMFKKTAVYSVNETTPIHSFNPWKK
jgi:hypothetical protein